MSTNREITIFLASSEELINDRNSFHAFISTLDDIYKNRGINIKLNRWENFSAFCTGTRTQDEYNKVLCDSDMCICLFHKRAGQYTIEEFKYAMAEYKRTGDHPKTYVYVRALVEGEIEEDELKQFKEELFKQMGHYWCNYATDDTMKLHFIMQFERLVNDRLGQRDDTSNISIDQGNVMLHGRKVADYNNIPFAANNTEIIALKEKIATLDKDIVTLRSIGNDMLLPMINEKLSERHEYQGKLEQLEKQLLDTALSISKMLSSGHPISERKRAAIEMFEKGNNRGVLDMLNEADIERDYQSAKKELSAGQQLVEAGQKTIKVAQDKIRSLIEEYLLKAKTWMSTYSEPNRFQEACKCHEQAIALTRESLTEEDLAKRLFDYGMFLQDNNQFHRIEEYYQEALEIYERLAKAQPETYESNVATTLTFLANLYQDTRRFDEAEGCYLRAVDIRKQLAEAYPGTYESYVAETMNNLGTLYNITKQINKAEEYYRFSLEIRERLAKSHPDAHHASIAIILNNLTILYRNTRRFKEAEEYCLRALHIYERLATNNPETYESYLAATLDNLSVLYCYINKFNNAEKHYLRALKIKERLATNYPEAYESDLSGTLNNLANLYYHTQRFNEAEQHFLRALAIRERLAITNPESYEANIAMTLNNLAYLYCNTQRFNESEQYFLRALAIRERLATAHPEVYDSDIAQTLNNLALLYSNTQRFKEADKYSQRALEIQRGLVAINPELYAQDYAAYLRNAAYYSLLVRKFSQAEEYSREALKWSDNINIYTNLAAAILLQGIFEEAKQIYLTYKDDLKDAFLEDFQNLKENNAIPEHLMDDVEKIIELLQ